MIVIRQFSFKLLPTLVTLLAFFIMCKLGFWQLDRAKQKEQELQAFSQMTKLTNTQLLAIAQKNIEDLHGRKAQLSGTLDSSNSWLVDNKTYMGKVGYSLVVKMNMSAQTKDEQKDQQSILVDLGWVAGGKYREQLPQVSLPEQLIFNATIKAKDFNQIILGDSGQIASNQGSVGSQSNHQRVQSYQQIFQTSPNNFLPIIVFAESNTLDDMPQLYKPVVMPPEKHVAYAVQWFLLALASLVVYGFASYHKTNTERSITPQAVKENNHES